MKKFEIATGPRLLGAALLLVFLGEGAALAEGGQTNAAAVTGARTNRVELAAAGAATNSLPDIITTSSNKFERCRITRVEPSAINVFHSKGIARILFEDLPEEWQKKYNYDPEKARVYEEALAERQRQGWANAESARHKEDAPRPSTVESTPITTIRHSTPPPKRAESVDAATEKSKKTAKRGIGTQNVPMPMPLAP